MGDQPSNDLPLDISRPKGGSQGAGGADAAPRLQWHRRYLLILLVPLLLFTGAVVGMYFQPPGLKVFYAVTGLQPGGGSASPIALPPEIELPKDMVDTMRVSDVVGLARLLPRGDISVVAPPYGSGDARIAALLVAKGDRVEKGQPVARLDNLDVLQSAVLANEAAVAVREAVVIQTRAAVLNSRDEAQAVLEQAQSIAAEASADLARTQQLYDRKVATRATLDAVTAAGRQASLAVAKAQATLSRFGAVEVENQPDVMVASRNLAAAKADLARAQRDLSRADVLAPIAGTILDIHVTPGQKPPVEGIMEIGNTDAMMAEVEIYQDRISQVAVGQPVELVATALGQTYQGKVEFIGLTVGRQGLVSDDTAANTDARVIFVTVALDAASSAQAARYTNLEVIARIDTQAAP